MDITVAVVTYNAARGIQRCVESILDQTDHGGNTEILVVDGCSDDGTQNILERFSGGPVRLIENPLRTIASNRNVVLREARYKHIAFTDADCIVPANWLRSLSNGLKTIRQSDTSVAGVGGGNIMPTHRNAFQLALGIALDSFVGCLGSVQGKIFHQQRLVRSVGCFSVMYDRMALQSIGGFDEELGNMCEDADVNYRLLQEGRTLYYTPDANVEHSARDNLLSWCVNMYAYGMGRAKIMCKHRTLFSPVYVLPLMFLPILLAAIAIGTVWPAALLVWLYVPVMMCAGSILAWRKNPLTGLRVGLILLGTHFCYAAGMWRGLAAGYHRSHSDGNKA